MPLHLTSEKWREKFENRMVFIHSNPKVFAENSDTCLTQKYIRKRKTFSLKCPAAEARVINTNCSTVKALVARLRAGPTSRDRGCVCGL